MSKDKINDIESYRKMRRRKRLLRRTVSIVLALALLVGIYFAFRYFKDEDILKPTTSSTASGGVSDQTGFPIKLAGEKVGDVGNMGPYITFLSDTKLAIYNDDGKNIITSPHGYTNPTMQSSSKRTLVYDRGGNEFRVESKGGTEYKQTTTNPIVTARISENGTVAVVTQDDRYASVLTVYDANRNEIYRYSSQEPIVAIDLNGSSGCAVAAVSTVKGEVVTTVYALDFSKEKEVFKTAVSGTMVLSIDYKSGDMIGLIGDDRACVLAKDGKLTATYRYNRTLQMFSNDADKNMVLMLSDQNSSTNNSLVMLDLTGKAVSTYKVEDTIRNIECDGSRVFLLTDSSVKNFDMSLKLLGSYKCDQDAKKMTFIGSKLYILGAQEIQKQDVQ